MGHPPKAMKYITCRVMSFRPWQASCGPLRGLSRLHSPISPSFSLFLLCLRGLFFSSTPALRATLLYSLSLLSSHSPFPTLHFLHSSSSSSFHPNLPALCLSVHPLPPGACPSSATSVPQSATAHCGAMIQKPHINTGISPRDYLSVACLPGRVLLCNLYSPMNRVGLGKRGFGGV